MAQLISRGIRRLSAQLQEVPVLPLSAYQLLIPRKEIGLCYHLVSDHAADHAAKLYEHNSASTFERHLLYLRERYHFLSYDELRRRLASGTASKDTGVFLSFDDGMVECFTVVRPLLLKYSIPCTFFVTSDFIDNASLFYRHKVSLALSALERLAEGDRLRAETDLRMRFEREFRGDTVSSWIQKLGFEESSILDEICSRLGIEVSEFLRRRKPYLDVDQIRSLAADGFSIGAHSKSHRRFSQLTQESQREEILGSSAIVKDVVGEDDIPFAFPFSGAGVDRAFLRCLKAEHPFLGLFFEAGEVRNDADFVFDRIPCESPASSHGPNRSRAMHGILKHAYHRHWIETLLPCR